MIAKTIGVRDKPNPDAALDQLQSMAARVRALRRKVADLRDAVETQQHTSEKPTPEKPAVQSPPPYKPNV